MSPPDGHAPEEYERALIGQLMHAPPTWAETSQIVGLADVATPHYRLIFGAIAALSAAGIAADFQAVRAYLDEHKQLEVVRELLGELRDETGSAVNVLTFARHVRTAAEKRRLKTIAADISAIADERDIESATVYARERVADFVESRREHGAAPLDWMEGYALTENEAEQISDPTWVEPGLIVQGHVIAIVAKPNGGKTTIVFHLGCRWAASYTVVYVDADTNPADAKRKLRLAQQYGVRYLTPDLKVGKSMRGVVDELERLASSDVDFSRQVWIFDTLKRLANVISKESLKHVLALMRKLSSRGMTCILLGHTNKYRNDDGEYQFEGTGDLESDCDELIYFEPRENDDKSLTVSTRCTKRRANIEPKTWDIDPNRNVTERREYVDMAAEHRRDEQREQDETLIELISEHLGAGPRKQLELVEHCAPYKYTHKRVRAVLKRYRGRLWLESRLPEKNALEYRLIPRGAHPGAQLA